MNAKAKTGFEPWAWVAFALGGLVALTYLYLGLRPGGRGPIVAFTLGLPLLGTAAGLLMAIGLAWSVLHKPVLQRGRLKALLCGAASVWAASMPIPFPSSHEGRPSTVPFRLPFEGERSVRWGGDERAQNARIMDPSRRFGVVFEPPEKATSVLAPAAGELRFFAEAPADSGSWTAVLEVASDEFVVIEGLAPPQAERELGLRFEVGAPLGVANVGPLGVHLEDRSEPGTGEGIPFAFRAYLSGGAPVERGLPLRGERVAPDPATSGR